MPSRHRLAIVICAGLTALLASCARPAPPAATPVRISSGPRGATYFILSDAIAFVYNKVTAQQGAIVLESGGASSNIESIEAGEAECGLSTSDVAYPAYSEGTARVPTPHTRLRGVAVLFPNVLHIVVRRTSSVVTLADLSGARIVLATPGQPSAGRRGRAPTAVLDVVREMAHGAAFHGTTTEMTLSDAVAALREGRADAGFFYGGYPFLPVTQLAEETDLGFVEFDDAAVSLAKERHPFFKPVVVPASTYRGQPRDVRTIAVDNLLVCRDDLPADLVYRLTRAVHENVGLFASIHPSGREINVEDGPSTPIPLHVGAARYYRERELFR